VQRRHNLPRASYRVVTEDFLGPQVQVVRCDARHARRQQLQQADGRRRRAKRFGIQVPLSPFVTLSRAFVQSQSFHPHSLLDLVEVHTYLLDSVLKRSVFFCLFRFT
jgi:hypothetical protein